MMMKKMKTSQLAKFKALLILPLIAGLMLAFVNAPATLQSATRGSEKTITGNLSDRLTGSFLPGTVVVIKGTNTGTIADDHGNYSIRIAEDNATLVYSHVGYKTQEIPVMNNAIINVQLDVDAMVVDFTRENKVNGDVNPAGAQNNSNKETYQVVEELPSYKGGTVALQKFLEAGLKYPEEAKKAGISGKVYVSFIVSAEGQVTDAKIMRSVSPLLNDESLRLTNSMKDWTPGSQNGKKQSMAVIMPIEFKLK